LEGAGECPASAAQLVQVGEVAAGLLGFTASHEDGMVKYTAYELRHVCASLLIASGATDMQVANQMGHSKIETTKNIYGHLVAQDRASILNAMNQAVTRLYVQEDGEDNQDGQAA
jgi:integrase